jgi:acyl-CoA dehydrogenase
MVRAVDPDAGSSPDKALIPNGWHLAGGVGARFRGTAGVLEVATRDATRNPRRALSRSFATGSGQVGSLQSEWVLRPGGADGIVGARGGPMILLNPKQDDRPSSDPESRDLMHKTIEFFEHKGKTRLKRDDHERVWYADFLDFVKRERVFATLLTPAPYGGGRTRWDTWRNCEFNEITAFYGLHYWYTWQVSILGLGPIWMGRNEEMKRRTAGLLEDGGIFAFGLSERTHGADLYSTEMSLGRRPEGGYLANGSKYYIGNANEAAIVSTFGKLADTGEFVFFAVDRKHGGYECVRNLVNVQSYVAEYRLRDYPIAESEILERGDDAWDAALNTVNVGKFNLGWASIGIATHAFYEAIDHAANRRLYNTWVTDFPHIRQLMTDAWTRLVAMKLFSMRAADYMRSASAEDRRYLLYNPLVKMKVTTQGEDVINLLWDVIAAKGFERDTYFEMATRDIRALPKLEGTVHVNMALVVKFMRNFLFAPATLPEIPRRDDPGEDAFLWSQGPTKGLGKVKFHDFRTAYDSVDLPNVRLFREQVKVFEELLVRATPSEAQAKDIDFLLTTGEIFTLVAYGQLILENARIHAMPDDVVDQIFDVQVRDLSRFALQLHSKPSATALQQEICLRMLRRPVVDDARASRVWKEHVYAAKGAYAMNE